MASNVTFNLAINALKGVERNTLKVIQRIGSRLDTLEGQLCQSCGDPVRHKRILREVEVLTQASLLIDLQQDSVIAEAPIFQETVADTLENIRNYLNAS